MSSKRHIRRRACERKKRHATQRAAIAHLITQARAFGNTAGLEPYHCRWCGGWHVGHPEGFKETVAAGGRLGRRR